MMHSDGLIVRAEVHFRECHCIGVEDSLHGERFGYLSFRIFLSISKTKVSNGARHSSFAPSCILDLIFLHLQSLHRSRENPARYDKPYIVILNRTL